jgi:cell division protein FtsB
MIKLKFLFAVLSGTAVYVALSLVAGTDGIVASHQLEAELGAMAERTARLEALNTSLLTEHLALQHDPEVIAAYARKLGYVAPGEKLVKVQGFDDIAAARTSGTVLPRTIPAALPEWVCKTVAFALGGLVFILSLLVEAIDALSHGKRDRTGEFAFASA